MMCCLSELTNSSIAVLPWPNVHRRFDFNSITWIGGRSIEIKKRFYKRIAMRCTSGPAYGKKTSYPPSSTEMTLPADLTSAISMILWVAQPKSASEKLRFDRGSSLCASKPAEMTMKSGPNS